VFLLHTLGRAIRRRARCHQASRAALGACTRATLSVAPLEDRLCPSGGYLIVGSFDNNAILRYNETTGAFVDQIDPHNLANLKEPNAGVFGPDGNLYVSSGAVLNNNHKVLQYNGTTGAFQTVFASQNLAGPRGLLFGPDGNLYVADANERTGTPAYVERFDGKTGAFLDSFLQQSSPGLTTSPSYMVFGPDGDLYVAAAREGVIYRYDGTTGLPVPAPGQTGATFVPAGSGGLDAPYRLDAPAGIAFGPDGNLYVASANWFTSNNGPFYDGDFPAGAVLRFNGTTGLPVPAPGQTGATFVPGGSGGLANPNGLLFGPNGDLYVASSVLSGTNGTFIAEPGTSQVLRYHGPNSANAGAPDPAPGQSGATFVPPDSGGLKNAFFLTFTETNPTTLKYNGTTTAATASMLLAQPASSTPLALALASSPSDSTSFAPAAVSVALAITQPPTAPAGITSPAPPSSSAPLPVLPLTSNLPPAGPHTDSPQPAWTSTSAADQVFASLDAELPLVLFVEDLALTPRK
jgi:sugar lactone lactonase YvrE